MNYLDYLSLVVADAFYFVGCVLLDLVDDVLNYFDPYCGTKSLGWRLATFMTHVELEVCGTLKVGAANAWLFLLKDFGRRWKFVRAPFFVAACFLSDQEDGLIDDLKELGWRLKD